ncbi:D-alanine--D-alanine ligase [Edwardsiella tarda]|uniref:D-alanine--D-alanine ligase n=1 Tax=Edwardsiella tarda TaxID=636 RepID=UPI000D52440E|nr:D-alanine--D-alanine ligase [Edwardsiella tarda]UCQ17990.1 D-alanine--D-alanine ligase [Edwardsiella tarda]
MAKIRVGIVFGGKSCEHEVSLQSAKNIVAAIDHTRFDVMLIGIDKQGYWYRCPEHGYLSHEDDPQHIALNHASAHRLAVLPGAHSGQLIDTVTGESLPSLDVIFPIVHGTQGEDGCLQGMLKILNLPFVGSDIIGSAACMDKDICKRLLRDARLPVTPFVTLTRDTQADYDYETLSRQLGSTLFVKPANQGSSVGVSKVRNAEEYARAIAEALRFDHKVIIELGVVGREIECAILGNEAAQASVCGEIILHSDFYSYDSKYISAQGAQVVVPAQMTPESSERVRQIALQAFQALECRGLARVDVFLTEEGEVIINEINTLPGFTNISMYPKLWQACGIDYPTLITRLIEFALARQHRDSQLCQSEDKH